ncbi:MAG TPA: exodeoxyribonuclease VII large subunit [Acidobacteriaceae bacterium]|nr:exodeoxyribonuclease VII large subunit [Acidobacteriaceae bacterium]
MHVDWEVVESPSKSSDQLGFTFEAVQPPQRHIWKVSELVTELRSEVERQFSDVWVEGEITDLRPAASGHIYFTLKDDSGQLSAVLFRRQASLLRFRPENGLQVLLRGRVSIYEQRGQIQIVTEHLEPMGAGSLQLAFEQVKRRLQQEGLFDAERKRPLPAFPRCVGIVTSPSGAVIRDFITVTSRRHAALHIILYPALVQGESAAAEVAKGIEYFNQTREVDLIVIARGGGSLEDLAPFNSESLARVIAASDLPVVSAVGHETDFTIADFAADLRAPTPSAAAEVITAAQHKVEEHLEQLSQRLQRATRYLIMQARERLSSLAIEASLARISDGLNRRQQRIDELCFRMEAAWRTLTQQHAQRLQTLTSAILRNDAAQRITLMRERLQNNLSRLTRAQLQLQQSRRAVLLSLERQLAALSPLGVLNRGYALVYDENGILLKDAAALAPGQLLSTRLAAGSLESRITRTTPGTRPDKKS